MFFYMIYVICFLTPLWAAILEGGRAGVRGIVIGLLVGLAVGMGAVFGMRAVFRWVLRHPQFGKHFPTPVWIVLDSLLCLSFFASLVGLCFLAAVITRSVIHHVI